MEQVIDSCGHVPICSVHLEARIANLSAFSGLTNAMERSFVTTAMNAANEKLREDDKHFIDWAASSGVFTEEHVIIE